MAEIKSTMEKVMERLAAMGEVTGTDIAAEEKSRDGMRLAAAYLRGEQPDLAKLLAAQPRPDQPLLLQGIVRTLLRNIMLPRDEDQRQQAEKAVQGLLLVSGGGGDLRQMFQEIKSILDRYLEHREQLRDQLKAAFSQQIDQMEGTLARQTGMKLKIDPGQHPKFKEEWQRLQGELNSQYGRAIDQYKSVIEQRLGGRK
ncbi:MAG: hypothetical protein M0017_11025 [Desulfobacteraceae bacterium]|nr:hypothetical protein [Desulfobacteraceae bacterium]